MSNQAPDALPNILVLGTADWDQAIATNQHYIVRELLSEHALTYSESLGLRKPELRRRDIVRMAKRLFGSKPHGLTHRVKRPRPNGLSIISPLVIPAHTGLARAINRRIIHNLFSEWISSPGPRVLWTYTPVTYDLEKFADVTVYHCVDLLGEFPGVSSQMIKSEEKRLSLTRPTAIASSEVVAKSLRDSSFKEVLLWPNVADVDAIVRGRQFSPPRNMRRVVFAGNLSKIKVDFVMLERVLDSGFELHLAGPIAEGGGDASAEVRHLVSRGAVYHGLLSMEELAKLYWSCSVGIIPYLINSYTRGVNPLKTFEYLAAGLGVVSTAVPAVAAIAGHVEVLDESSELVEAINSVLAPNDPQIAERRLDIASEHSWSNRGRAARELLNSALADH